MIAASERPRFDPRRARPTVRARPAIARTATGPPNDRDKDATIARQERRLSLIERKLAAVQAVLDEVLALAKADDVAPLPEWDDEEEAGT